MSKKSSRKIEQDPQQQRLAEKSKETLKTPQDVTSERAKSSRQGKVTADKWNQ